jgi:hypothetical protein
VLAKAIVVGNSLGIGDHFRNRPLIVSTLYRRLCFGILMLGFSVMENLIAGWWCGKNSGAVLQSILREGLAALLTRLLVVILEPAPLFAVRETRRGLGKGKLFELYSGGLARKSASTTAKGRRPRHDAGVWAGVTASNKRSAGTIRAKSGVGK